MAFNLIFRKILYLLVAFFSSVCILLPIAVKFLSRIGINLVIAVLASCVVVVVVTYVYGLIVADYVTLITLVSVFCYLSLPKESEIVGWLKNITNKKDN